MIDYRIAPVAALILRLATDGLFGAHAGLKLPVITPAGTAGFFESVGLPGLPAYSTMCAEVFGGLALILGIYSGFIALGMTAILLGAIATMHAQAGNIGRIAALPAPPL